jgi:predicted phage terminase large subunit-like protein
MTKKSNEDPVLKAILNYYTFFQWCWPIISKEKLILNWHIAEIANILQKIGLCLIERKRPEFLKYLFSVPPGSTKSSLISQVWPVWLWLWDPSIKILVVSYADDAAVKNSFAAKSIIKSEEFQNIFVPLFKRMHGKDLTLIRDLNDDWQNAFTGQYYATTITGQATSMHFNVQIFDDAQNAAIADSESKRIASNRMHDLTFPSRKVNKEITPSIYVMQRFNEDDTIGHELKKPEPYYYLCLPAELNDNVQPEKHKYKYIDNLLDPVRLNRSVLEKFKSDLGSFGYAGQFLQNPYPEEGGHIKKDWFMICDEVPDEIAWDLWIDGAYTDKAKNDPTGFMIAGFDVAHGRLYVKYAHSDWLVIPDVIKKVTELMTEHSDQAGMIFVEPKASGYSFIQMIQEETLYNVTRITGRLVQDGKMARVKYASPKVESSRVYLLRGNWNNEFITQLTAFPNYSHDEFADLLGYAVKKYFG